MIMMALTWLSAILVGAGCLALGYYIGVRRPARFLVSAAVAKATVSNNANKKNRSQESLEIEKLADILEDFKMVLVVRNDLKMGKGKIAAQCSHATLGLYKKLHNRAPKALNRWEMCGQVKVVVKTESEEEMLTLQARAKSVQLPTHIVIDAGRTQIAPDSRTVMAILGPADMVDDVTGGLKLLAVNMSRRNLASSLGTTGNPIDDCWQQDENWDKHHQSLADCAIGFGKKALGGKDGKIYVVTSPRDDPMNPQPGTLRYGVIQDEPLWIIFGQDMVIKLKQELVMNSFKTIDGRGANVHIEGGACITMSYVTNIIIHGIHIHDCKRTGNAYVRDSPNHYGWRTKSDGDGILITSSSHIWVDHCSLSRCTDGLIDVIRGSTAITISNNYMTHHNKVMLLGNSDSYTQDRDMQVTIAFNHFGEGLIQRMPRCRHGYFHVVNNDYTHWRMYAIGGSAGPTINSQGNRFLASNESFSKEVTKRENAPKRVWKNWNWRSQGDLFLNGAHFVQSGSQTSSSYAKAMSLKARPFSLVRVMTRKAGPLACQKGTQG